MNAPLLPATDLPAWLAERLRDPPPRQLPIDKNRPSAVLLPVLQRPDGPRLLMVRKSAKLQRHAGQMGFPGGALDAGETPESAALREAWEEVGLEPERVQLLGHLDDDRTYVTDYHIAPIVGWVSSPPETFRIDGFEIDAVHELDLAEVVFAEPANWLEYRVGGLVYRAPRYELSGDVVVWGASARIVHNLQRRLRADSAIP